MSATAAQSDLALASAPVLHSCCTCELSAVTGPPLPCPSPPSTLPRSTPLPPPPRTFTSRTTSRPTTPRPPPPSAACPPRLLGSRLPRVSCTSDVSSRASSLYFIAPGSRRVGRDCAAAVARILPRGTPERYSGPGGSRRRVAIANSPTAATALSARQPSHSVPGLAAYTREPRNGASTPDAPQAKPAAPM